MIFFLLLDVPVIGKVFGTRIFQTTFLRFYVLQNVHKRPYLFAMSSFERYQIDLRLLTAFLQRKETSLKNECSEHNRMRIALTQLRKK